MHTFSRIGLLIPALLSLLVAGCSGPERIVLRGGTEYFPLLHERLLRYQEHHSGTSKDYTLRLTFTGGRTVRIFNAEFDGINMGVCNFISRDSVVYLETDQPMTSTELYPGYRQIWVDEYADPGDSWIDEDMGTETVFAGFEIITVPAGTFADCYKTVVTPLPGMADSLTARFKRDEMTKAEYERQLPNANLVIVRWFAKGIGLVKEQIGSPDFVRELVEIVRPGTGRENLPITDADQPIEEDVK